MVFDRPSGLHVRILKVAWCSTQPMTTLYDLNCTKQRPNTIGIFAYNYNLYCQICNDVNLDIETIYKKMIWIFTRTMGGNE